MEFDVFSKWRRVLALLAVGLISLLFQGRRDPIMEGRWSSTKQVEPLEQPEGLQPSADPEKRGTAGSLLNYLDKFRPEDPSWTAHDVLHLAESARASIRVPFYIYGAQDGVFWEDDFDKMCAACESAFRAHQWGGDFLFLHDIRNHSWRTSDPNLAQIFVIPVVIVAAADEKLRSCNYTMDSVNKIFTAVMNTTTWQTYKHLHLASHMYFSVLRGAAYSPAIIYAHESNDVWITNKVGMTLIAPYNNYPAGGILEDANALVNNTRDIRIFFGGSAKVSRAKRNYYIRWHLFRTLWNETDDLSALFIQTAMRHVPISLPKCNPSMRSGACWGHSAGYLPAEKLNRSIFTLSLRGDVPATRRLYEASQFGSISVFIADDILDNGTPFQCLVPYSLFTLQVMEKPFFADAKAALLNVTRALSQNQIRRMREVMFAFAKDFLWQMGPRERSRVAENILIEAKMAADIGMGRGHLVRCPFERNNLKHYKERSNNRGKSGN